MNILINGIGGPTSRSVARTLNYSDNNYQIVGTDCDRLAVSLYQNKIFNETFLIPRAGDISYWDAIERIIEKKQIDMAIVLPELEVLEWGRRADRGKLPCKSLIPSYSLSTLLIDKARMTEILTPGHLAPRSITIDAGLRISPLDGI